jgi:hypothetical protein
VLVHSKEIAMLEHLYPGVYVEEYDARAKPIPGVSTSTGEFALQSLAAELRETVRRVEPDWTGHDAADPGVTLLEVLAWIAETVIYRASTIPERGRQAAMRAVAALATLSAPCGRADEALARPRFFSGQLVAPADLQLEQDYHREKHRRHNRALHGAGIVAGLEVSVEAGAGAPAGRIHITPGYALDPHGEELGLRRGAEVALPQAGEQRFVSLRHQDVPCAPVPSPSGEPVFSRIEEACVVALVDTVAEPAIALARLLRSEGRWTVDRSFVPQRAARGST